MSGWNENLSNINEAIIEMIANPAMVSETARNIYAYMYDVHSSIVIMVSHIISDFICRQMLYEAGMYEIDSYELSRIPSVEIEDLINHYTDRENDFEDDVESVNQILYNISDVLTLETLDSENVFNQVDDLVTRENDYLNRFRELDEEFSTVSCSSLEKSIDDTIAYKN